MPYSKDNPFVTVLFLISNQSTNIQQSLNSVLSQTYKRLNLLVIDGSGKSETKRYIKSLINQDVNIKYIEQKEMTSFQIFHESFNYIEKDDSDYIQ